MPAGRPRKPVEQKILQGTFRKHRNPEDEAKFSKLQDPPAPPDTLNEYGKSLWNRLASELTAAGVLTTPDLPAFEDLCERYGYAKKLREAMGDDLAVFLEEDNSKNKYIAYKTEMAAVWVMMAAFGLSPSARNKFGVNKKPDETESDKIMKRILGGA
jgi:P27 family predicted phage terminase small subunit